MTQLDDLQTYVNENMPLRPIQFRWDNPLVAYDGDPNDGGAPTILGLSPAGTFYLQSDETRWRKEIGGNWALNPILLARVTQEAFTITVSGAGADPTYELRLTSQAGADAWGAFLTVGGAISALYDMLLQHDVTFQLPAGVWNLSPGELDQAWRVNPTKNGAMKIAGDPGWAQVPTTSEVLAVSSDSSGNVVLASDPFAAVDAKATYLYVVSGTGINQYLPIRTHSGVNVTVAGIFNPPLDGTSLVRVSRPATELVFGEQITTFKGKPEVMDHFLFDFSHLELNTSPAYGWFETSTASLRFGDGTIFHDIGIWSYMSANILGNVIFDVRDYAYPCIFVQSGYIRTEDTGSVHFFLANSLAWPAVFISGNSAYSSFGIAAFLFLSGFAAFDGFTGPYVEVTGSHTALDITVGGSTTWRSDQGGSSAIKVTDGATASIASSVHFEASTFKGAAVDIDLDGSTLAWTELGADPDNSMISQRGSVVMGEPNA